METNGEIKIEKGIPIPESGTKMGKVKYLLTALEVGDSFAYPKSKRGSVLPCAQRYNVKVVTRTEGDHIRVWRIA